MTGRGRILRFLAFLTGLVLLVQATTALADDDPPTTGDELEWISVSCATGGFDNVRAGGDPAAPIVRIDAFIRPCQVPGRNTRFAFTLYTSEGFHGTLRPYDGGDVGSTTSFSGVLDYSKYREAGEPRALCVSYGPRSRAACVELDTLGRDGLPVGAPVDTDDPRVAMPAQVRAPTDPHCGTCL
jgi:hypothetical protein